ncbi:MAG: hypothetical protein Q8K75_10035 [Chlamydiales bacterium]|nr:hypothetical protein [Chlamydiales bacterium]
MDPISASRSSSNSSASPSAPISSKTLDFCRKVTLDAGARAAGPAAIGIGCLKVANLPTIAWPLLGHAAGMLTVRLAKNLTNLYNTPLSKALYDIEEEVRQLVEAYPFLKAASLAACICIAFFSISVGLALGFLCGGLTALSIDWERNQKGRAVSHAQEHGTGLGGIINQMW